MAKTSLLLLLTSALLPLGSVLAQDSQPSAKDAKPEPKALPALAAPAGVLTFKAECFWIAPYNPTGATSTSTYFLAVTVGSKCLPTSDKPAVVVDVATTAGLTTLLTDANKNFSDVQSGMIDALLLVLNDQSIKADNIKDLIPCGRG